MAPITHSSGIVGYCTVLLASSLFRSASAGERKEESVLKKNALIVPVLGRLRQTSHTSVSSHVRAGYARKTLLVVFHFFFFRGAEIRFFTSNFDIRSRAPNEKGDSLDSISLPHAPHAHHIRAHKLKHPKTGVVNQLNLLVDEIVSSELTYVAQLVAFVNRVVLPTRGYAKQMSLTAEQVANAFSNIEQVATFHSNLYNAIAAAASSAPNDGTPAHTLTRIEAVVRIFLRLHERADSEISLLYKTYIAYMAARSKAPLEQSAVFRSFFTGAQQEMRADVENALGQAAADAAGTGAAGSSGTGGGGVGLLSLDSYAVLPVQRPPRFMLLLQQLLKLLGQAIALATTTSSTSTAAPASATASATAAAPASSTLTLTSTLWTQDEVSHLRALHESTSIAVERIMALCSLVNEASRRVNNMQKLADCQHQIDGYDISKQSRTYIREGVLEKHTTTSAFARSHQRYFYLFDDLLLWTHKKECTLPLRMRYRFFRGTCCCCC